MRTKTPGATSIDNTMSFGLISGGHRDVTVVGGLQVDEQGRLASWMIPSSMIRGMGGAMDRVSGAKRVIVAMTHTAKGKPKIVPECVLPVTSLRRVGLVVTEVAVIETTEEGLVLREVAPDATVDQVTRSTAARLIVPAEVPPCGSLPEAPEDARC
jgi:acetate CoA/acetoacetate CoA-transferase beta subunit